MNPDFLDLLRASLDAEVRFMVVGAYAVGVLKSLPTWTRGRVGAHSIASRLANLTAG